MVKNPFSKKRGYKKDIKTKSGKRLYTLIQEDFSHSQRIKRILARFAASLAIVFIILLLVKYLV
ncbi:MAG: hypothetical protein KAJ56_00680 [Candidatus Aenigmarchaeota archaeon]|nr:hypothetical protein [Candidatus Aenigmarchaeota archaeon]MCK5289431.1 hypothetical protein [Candidatus Aenigmarchaeota archaeon]